MPIDAKQVQVNADFPVNSHKITGLANGSNPSDAAAFGQVPNVSALIHADGSVPFAADQSLAGHKLTNLAAGVAGSDAATVAQLPSVSGVIKADGSVAFAADESMGGHKLTNLADAIAGTDATNLNQVTAAASAAESGAISTSEAYTDSQNGAILEVPHTVNYQLLNTDFGKRHSNRGALAPVILTLPDPSTMTGPSWDPTVTPLKPLRIACVTAQDLKVLNFDNSTILYLGSKKQTVAGGFARAIQGTISVSPGSVAVGALLTIWWMGASVGWMAEVTGDWKPDA